MTGAGIFRRAAGRTWGAGDAAAPRRERLIHALWAAGVTFVLAAAMFLEPIDWMLWTVQSRMSDQQPSGRIVYVRAAGTIADPAAPERRAELAAALDRMREAGAARVYLDVVFPADRSATPTPADRSLAAALDRWGPRAAIVNRIDLSTDTRPAEVRSAASFTRGRREVWNGFASSWPNFAWQLPYAFETSDGPRPSLAADIAGLPGAQNGKFAVEYTIRSYAIPALPLGRMLEPGGAADLPLAGKVIVIGTARDPALPDLRMPNQMSAPASFVPIQAAETLLRGPPTFVSGFKALALVTVLLVLGIAARTTTQRRIAYAVAAAAPLYLWVVAGHYGLRIELSYCLPLLAIYLVLRWRANWKRRIAQIDQETGLPSLRALVNELAQQPREHGYIVTARVHGYDTILKSLEPQHRASYMTKLAERIRVGDARSTVFIDGNHLGWWVTLPSETRLREHLEGLRAIFAAPVTVDARSIDVGITFGAAAIDHDQLQRSLSAALAEVEETSEALEPIRIAAPVTDSDPLWDMSLRARIDAAMEAGEVFCVYQPKMDIAVDRLIGVEALVRWKDPERGYIPPLHFVMQCEKAGRMEYLTRYVLQSACTAGKLLHFRGSRITMSVNISATLLSDMRIVGIVRNVLQATGFDPNYLVLEITETARIRDLAQARSVLNALKALGARLSMDDFGSGAANFETLHALPFDEIKIDRQFIAGASASTKARAIAASIVGLGTTARITVVAEGAETASDLQMLRDIGCWQVQGYALSRPIALTNLLNILTEGPDAHQRA